MDPGQVVWLPGSGYDQQWGNWACEMSYGGFSYDCGEQSPAPFPYDGGTLIYCC